MANRRNNRGTLEESRIDVLYRLMQDAIKHNDIEAIAVLRWAIFELEQRFK
jgi:hypothetical protein